MRAWGAACVCGARARRRRGDRGSPTRSRPPCRRRRRRPSCRRRARRPPTWRCRRPAASASAAARRAPWR
eukprot:2668002-Prymnesium_polylepis.1